MSVVYCDLVNGIDWYALTAWSSATTYALDALVKTSASTTSANAQVYKSLQAGNINHAVTDGAWWTLVADGSAAKPFKTIDDSTRGLTGGDECRVAKSPAHTLLSDSYTFYYSGANAGKCIKTGSADTINVGDFIGDDTAFWRVRAISGTGPYTLSFGSAATEYSWSTSTEADITLNPCYKAGFVTPVAAQNIQSNGTSFVSNLNITAGWDLTTISQTTSKRTYMATYGLGSAKSHITVDGICTLYADRHFFQSNSFTLKNAMLSQSQNTHLFGYNAQGKIFLSDITLIAYPAQLSTGTVLVDCIALTTTFSGPEGSQFKRCKFTKNANCDVLATKAQTLQRFTDCDFNGVSGGISGVFYNNSGNLSPLVICQNCTFTLTAIRSYNVDLISMKHQGVDGDHRTYRNEGNIFSDATTRHTASGLAWRYEPSTGASSLYALEMIDDGWKSPFQIGVSSGQVVTATIYIKKSSADAGLEAVWTCKGGQSAGPTSDVSATATDSTDWQQLSVTFTATATGVVELSLQVWGSSTATVHCDDFGASAA